MVSVSTKKDQRRRSTCKSCKIVAVCLALLFFGAMLHVNMSAVHETKQMIDLQKEISSAKSKATSTYIDAVSKTSIMKNNDGVRQKENKDISSSTNTGKDTNTGTEAQQKYKTNPLEGWIYEPKNVHYFWKKMGDRPFQREFYSEHLGKYNKILDVGVRGYNR